MAMAKRYEDMTDKEKAGHDKWKKRQEGMETGGKAMMGLGCAGVIFGVMIMAVVAVILMIFL